MPDKPSARAKSWEQAPPDAERAQLLALLSMMPGDLAVMRGPDHVLEFASAGLLHEIGGVEALGKPFRNTFPALADQRLHAELDAVFGSGQATLAPEMPMPGRLDADRAGGRYFDMRLEPIRDAEGNVDGVAVIALEVTERVNSRRQIEYMLGEMRRQTDELADQALGCQSTAPDRSPEGGVEAQLRSRVAALESALATKEAVLERVTQDLRAPLQVLMGFGGILHREVAGALTARQHDYLNKLLGSASVMAHLIDSVLDAGRVARGELSLTPRVLDFTELLEAAIAEQRDEAVSHHQHVEIDIPAHLPVLYADSERLHQVIAELLGNAIKFTPDGGTIRVRAREEGARVLFEVENTGQALSREAIARLFQPYASLEPALAQAETGVGLGLHVSRAIAEAHGGTLQVESRPGAGSVFRLSLPTMDSNRLLGQRFPSR